MSTQKISTGGGSGHAVGCACPFCTSNAVTGEAVGVDLMEPGYQDALGYDEFDWHNPDHAQAMVETAQRAARRFSRAFGCQQMTVDDIAQAAIIDVQERLNSGGKIRDVLGYVNSSARGLASRDGRPVRAENLAAARLYKEWEQQWATENGGMPPQSVKNAKCQEIRDNWHDPRHKPALDFLVDVQGGREKVRSIGMTDEVFDKVVSMSGSDDSDAYVAPHSHLDRALHAAEGHEGNRKDARRMLWNALAESRGVPLVEPTLTPRQITAIKKDIADQDAFEDALDGDQDLRGSLLTPWAGKDERDQEAVIDMLREHRSIGFDLWQAAVIASRRGSGAEKQSA